MALTPSSRLRLPLQGTGDNTNAWGEVLNGLFQRIDESQGAVTVAVNANVTLTNDNYVSNQSRYAGLRLTGTGLVGNSPALVSVPAVDKWRIVKNDCAGDILIGTGLGLSATVRAGRMSMVLCDGTDTFVIDPTLDQIRKAAADLDLNGFRIVNAANGVNPTDFATLQQTVPAQSSLAKAWATQASGEVVTGQGYSALFNANLAKAWATQATGEVITGQGFSAFYYAQMAASFANAGKASTAQAQAGTDDTTYMTPLKTAQAIVKFSPPAPTLDDFRTALVQLAKLKGSTVGMAAGVADDFRDQTGIDTVNSVSIAFDATNNQILNVDPFAKALLHFDGANGATTFTDDVGHVFTPAGGAKLSTAQSVFGGSSALFATDGDYIATPASTDFGLSTGDLTVQCRLYFTTRPASSGFIFDGRTSTGAGVTGLYASVRSDGVIFVSDGASNSTIVTGAALATGQWYDIEISRAAGTMRLFVNGALVNSAASAHDFGSSQPLRIGAAASAANSLAGYMDEFRLSKGVGRHTAAFTPATMAFVYQGAMDLRSAAFTAAAVPAKGSIFALVKATAGTITANTNLLADISRDGGTTWTTGTLVSAGAYSGFTMYEANSFDISGQPSGTSMKWRLRTVGTALGVAVDAVVAQWG